MFSFLKKKEIAHPDLSFIGVDMHSHLLPGIDDGVQNVAESLTCIKELQKLGYKKLICTPHIIADMYPNNHTTIFPKLDEVRMALKEHNIDMTIDAAAEYMVDIEMEKLVLSGESLLTFGSNFILIEMSYVAPSPNIEQVIFQLRLKGLQPILAHPERYVFYHKDFQNYQRFVDLGCMLQMNLLSLLGYYGKQIKLVAEKLLKNKMIDLVGTDMHHPRHLTALIELSTKKEFYKLFEGIEIKNKKMLM